MLDVGKGIASISASRREKIVKESRRSWFEFIRIAAPSLLLLAMIFAGVHLFQYTLSRKLMDVREHSHIKIGNEAIRNDIRVATSDLIHIAGSNYMKDLLNKGSETAKAQLISEFESLLNTKKLYDQIRYLDETGMEIIRLNFNSGMPLVVPTQKLQNKAHRYYFKDTMKLNSRTVFVSPMDLNIENGTIERPLKPMLRFGTPVFDDTNRRRGIVIINYLATNILENIERYLDNPFSDTMLLDARGYWLKAPDEKDEWGFMFNNQRQFATRFPDVWQEMIHRKRGQIESADGLFTFVTIYPLLEEHVSNTWVDARAQESRSEKDYFWILITHVDRSRLNAERAEHIRQGTIQFALVSSVVLLLAWLFSRERVYRKSTKRALLKKEHYLNLVTSQMAEGLLVTDRQGRLTSLNKEAERLLGWNFEDLAGVRLETVLLAYPSDSFESERGGIVARVIKEGVPHHIENVRIATHTGKPLPVFLSIAPFRHEGRTRGVIITFRDISEQLRMQEELKRLASHDPLTGVKNRGEIERLLAEEFKRAQRYNHSLVLMMIDFDHFKKINDTFGHPMGDAVLIAACTQMKRILRSNDVLGRYGGEEFLVILPETKMPAASAVAERLCASMAALEVPVTDQGNIRFTVSIGLAAYPQSADNPEELIQIADAMLYRAKENGRNQVISADDESVS